MIKKEKIIEIIENLCNHYRSECKHSEANAMLELLSIINGLQEEPECDELNKEIERVSGEIQYWPLEEVARHFANWQKQQMMNYAVDGEVINDHGTYSLIVPSLPIITRNMDEGDKVKVIIIKKE